jgi:hypothetical protein
MVAEERSFLTCAKLSTVDSEIDYTKHAEPELVDMFERLDPRYAPTECARLAKFLTERGYIVTEGTTGPGSAAPSPQKLEQLIKRREVGRLANDRRRSLARYRPDK